MGDGDGDGGGGDEDGDGEADGELDGDADGEADGELDGDAEALGDDDGVGDAVHAPGRNGSCESLPQPIFTPDGREYQSRMFDGRALTNRFMMVRPTFSPYARISP
ncbi:MAG TPA: hypothetical protein VFV03_00630, partial [Solirubrobacteraceae bacterium]|nr:hypothetical protein [Solirubrobacteraceae bacterium]